MLATILQKLGISFTSWLSLLNSNIYRSLIMQTWKKLYNLKQIEYCRG